ACFTVSPVAGFAPFDVTLDASCSDDLEGKIDYKWSWQNDGKPNALEVYEKSFFLAITKGNTHTFTLMVEDSNGNTSRTTRNIFVNPSLQQTMSTYSSIDGDFYKPDRDSIKGSFYETVLVNGKLTKEFSAGDHVNIMATIVSTETQENIQLLFAKAIGGLYGANIFECIEPFCLVRFSDRITKDQPLNINFFSGTDIMEKLGLGYISEDKAIDIYVGYQLADGEKVFNTTPISLKYTP
ncbi:MAG: PKD domain-containing protein, partial [Proteobacteria bacterium]|nr:PKD domain-containing protein [Pseudomonadota bacterium]